MTETNSPTFIEVNGVRFETLVPQPLIKIPAYGETTSVPLEVRITNVSDVPYRFDLRSFYPQLLDPQGRLIGSGLNQNSSTLIQDEEIPLIMPQNEVKLYLEMDLIWYDPNLLRLIKAIYGGSLKFYSPIVDTLYGEVNIYPETYRICFKYVNQLTDRQMFLFSAGRTQVNDFWIGEVYTPFSFIEFQVFSNP